MISWLRWPRLRPGGAVLALALLLPGPATLAAPAASYHIDQRYGAIGFSIGELGLFTTEGNFRKFAGHLVIDPADPTRTKISVTIDVGSVAMSSTRAVKLILSPAYFDVQQHPAIRFRSTTVAPIGRHRYLVSGLIRMRGVTHPQQFIAVLTAGEVSGTAPVTGWFTVTGTLHRSLFGMTANENFLGDVVRIVIHIHLTLPEHARAN
ncbi:MAG: YceI family protein [Acetobacteraceae bacterium]